jgi:hypothetical protein
MSDWQVGDLALCVDASQRGSEYPSRLVKGSIYTVTGIDTEPGLLDTAPCGLLLAEVAPAGHYDAFACDRFRKIRPDEHEACEPEFVRLLKRSKTPDPVSASIARANDMSAQWDKCAHALKRGDFTAFDEAMARFRKIQGDAR